MAPVPRQIQAPRPSRATGPEVVLWPWLSLLLPVAPLLLLFPAGQNPAERQPLLLADDEPVLSRPFRLEDGWRGSPAIELDLQLPANSSAVLGVELLDDKGRTMLDLSKDAWREIGRWSEEGESGTYDESDSSVPLELRPQRSGQHRLEVTLEDLLDASGQPLSTPLMASLSVRNHNLDGFLLVGTAAVAALIVRLFWLSVYGDCRSRRVVRVSEDTIQLRRSLGGPGLLRLDLRARYEPEGDDAPPTTVSGTPLRLRIEDRLGRSLFDSSQQLRLAWQTSRSGDSWWGGRQEFLFRVGEPDNLRLRIEVNETLPDVGAELEWLQLVVEDGVVCSRPREVTELIPRPATAPRIRPAAESLVVLALALAGVLAGSAAAITRPAVYRLGQEGTPVAASGVRYRGSIRAGRWQSQERHADWSRFPGRGPGSAK